MWASPSLSSFLGLRLGAFPFIMGFGGAGQTATTLGAVGVEAWTTGVLACAILTLTSPANSAVAPGAAPFWIGGVVTGLIAVVAPLTGAGFNPTRDLAPRLVAVAALLRDAGGGDGGVSGGVSGGGLVARLVGGSAAASWRTAFPCGWWAYTVGPVGGALLGALFQRRLIEPALVRAKQQSAPPAIAP